MRERGGARQMSRRFGALGFGGAGVFAALEWNNPGTLGGLTPPQKLMAALFQSVTLRTAGFATFDQNALSDVSKAAADFLMLIGGSSGSTAGGVKTVTVGVILLAAWSTARGRTSVQIMKRRIPRQAVENASALSFWCCCCPASARRF